MDASSSFNDLKMDSNLFSDYWFNDLSSNLELPPLLDDLDWANTPCMETFDVCYDDWIPSLQVEDPWDTLKPDAALFDMDFPWWDDHSTSAIVPQGNDNCVRSLSNNRSEPADAASKSEFEKEKGNENITMMAKDLGSQVMKPTKGDVNSTGYGGNSGGCGVSFERKNRSVSIDFEEISRYFYLPITRAAKEMKMGLTLLKKRCRVLGIKRWPHRKMKSLESLIQNVQEMKRSDGEGKEMGLGKESIERLKEHKRLMEKMPEMQLTEGTKKLRQACFKASYKKRKRMALAASSSFLRPCSYPLEHA